MSTAALIGPAIQIKGQVTAREPLTIAGRVDGTVSVDGHSLTIVAGGHISANITAPEIVVGGEVNGDIDATVRITVRETARIEGDMNAPKVSVADGAKYRGRVRTK
jgi:cytoskeletal protein CcmA (bactofilin family)